MKLPDYRQCVEINQLLVAMGVIKIPILPVAEFVSKETKKVVREYIDTGDIKIDDQLEESVIPVNKSEIAAGRPGELLEYKGRKVCAYIRDQKAYVNFPDKISNYRYHLCNCGILQSMRNYGREHRYLITKRSDGLFKVNDLTVQPVKNDMGENNLVRMELCKFCINVLEQKGIYSTPFSLKKYYEKYDSYTPKTIKKIEEVTEMQTYSPNQKQISLEYRKANNFICQICAVKCRESQGLTQLHHIDGNPANNKSSNFQVLCVDCHSKQFKHQHMLQNKQFKKQINIIKQLRTEQGILSVA